MLRPELDPHQDDGTLNRTRAGAKRPVMGQWGARMEQDSATSVMNHEWEQDWDWSWKSLYPCAELTDRTGVRSFLKMR